MVGGPYDPRRDGFCGSWKQTDTNLRKGSRRNQKIHGDGSPRYKAAFVVSEAVKIVDGPFADFLGSIESIDEEKGKVKVLVSIFGRETPGRIRLPPNCKTVIGNYLVPNSNIPQR